MSLDCFTQSSEFGLFHTEQLVWIVSHRAMRVVGFTQGSESGLFHTEQ